MATYTEYAIRRDHDGRKPVYYIVDTRNPHVEQHSGFFSTRGAARTALKRKCWGEQITGNC